VRALLGRRPLEHRRHRPARTAPRRPEVDDDGQLGAPDHCVEASLVERYRLAGAVFLGGEEKLRDPAGAEELAAVYGLPLRRAREGGAAARRPAAAAGDALDALLRETAASIVVDLSDEPVLGYR
jgi:hypothetical protein